MNTLHSSGMPTSMTPSLNRRAAQTPAAVCTRFRTLRGLAGINFVHYLYLKVPRCLVFYMYMYLDRHYRMLFESG